VEGDELQNLAANPQHEDALKDLRVKLDRWMRQQGDLGLSTESAVAEIILGEKIQGGNKPQSADDKPK
jgi:hypothetical protein